MPYQGVPILFCGDQNRMVLITVVTCQRQHAKGLVTPHERRGGIALIVTDQQRFRFLRAPGGGIRRLGSRRMCAGLAVVSLQSAEG